MKQQSMNITNVTAFRLLYDNIHDFKSTAMNVESEIKRHGIRNDGYDAVPGMQSRIHHDMWVSMKTVSHFNLGIALELMLKLLLSLNNIPMPHSHYLTKLHDAIPKKYQQQLEATYQKSKSCFPDDYKLIAFINTASSNPLSQSPPTNREILNLRGFFEYLDEDVMLWEKRYSWELVEKKCWRHYLSDISVFVELINRVMQGIKRD